MKTKKNSDLRVGIIGVGGMGTGHARNFEEGKIPGARLTAVSDSYAPNLDKFTGVEKFGDAQDLIRSGTVDAVLIVTPHFSHAPLSIAALKGGLHVLVEKPLTVRKDEGEKIVAAHRKSKGVFAIMFNQRTDPLYLQVKKWLTDGTAGKVQRVSWTITDWYRTNAYYGMGSWRGTWEGEGGGILTNQAPHNLDLWQWLFGMPKRVRAVGRMGRFHPIEVEDDVTALLEYADGMTGVFTTTTGEAPGLNRLEIAADNGLIVVDGRTIRFTRNKVPASRFTKTAKGGFERPEVEETVLEFKENGLQHIGIVRNFVDAIKKKTKLIAPGAEGLASLELSNAMIVSICSDKPVDLPMKAVEFTRLLNSLILKNKKRTKK